MEINIRKLAAVLFISTLAMVGGTGCEQDGPLENAGEEVDEAARDAKRAVDDATD